MLTHITVKIKSVSSILMTTSIDTVSSYWIWK